RTAADGDRPALLPVEDRPARRGRRLRPRRARADPHADLLRFIVARGATLMHSDHAIVFLRDETGALVPAAAERLELADVPPLALSADEAAQLQRRAALARSHDQRLPLILPLNDPRAAASRLIGALALGPRRSGQPYTADDRALLLALAD